MNSRNIETPADKKMLHSGGGGVALTRTFEFVQPKKGVMSVVARCTQRQRLSVHAGSALVLQTDQVCAGIPYGDCFRVQSHWVVRFF